MSAERQSLRVEYKKTVLINNSIKSVGIDISEGGISLCASQNLPAGIVVTLSLPVLDKTIVVKAKVLHSQPGMVVGLMFVDLTDEQRADLRALTKAGAGPPRPKRILFVEDDRTQRLLYKSRLTLRGYSVLEAEGGIEALTLIEKETFDLAVLDLNLERLDGYKVLAVLRQRQDTRDLPVLVLTSNSSDEEKHRALRAGANEYLVKTNTGPLELSECVAKYLKCGL